MNDLPRLYRDLSWIWPLLSPPEDYEEEAQVIVEEFERLGVERGDRVLHLGSGGGSLDWHLKSKYEMAGVDFSESMAQHAASVNPEVEYWHGDMREFRHEHVFEGVLIHDAIAYMTTHDDLAAVFASAAAHLNSGGGLVCLPEQLREQFVQHEVEHQTHTADGVSVTTVEVNYDPDPFDTVFETTFAYFIRRDGDLTVEIDRHHMGIFPLGDYIAAARSAGFDVEAVEIPLSDMPPEKPYTLIVGRKR
ncbi:MAG TPA: class I SAM-dependent methyltransferase [Fimbriimonadaceae bacterium]|nr:class I SAM-dependent methyltransferase [Fimbriimonadaceae bacterium]